MSRRQGQMTERSPGHWLIRYSISERGGRRRLAVTVTGTRKDAERELRRRLNSLDDGTHVDPSRMTTSDWLTRWLDMVSNEVSPATHVLYTDHVMNYLIPALGELPIAKLTELDIQSVYTRWATSGRRD